MSLISEILTYYYFSVFLALKFRVLDYFRILFSMYVWTRFLFVLLVCVETDETLPDIGIFFPWLNYILLTLTLSGLFLDQIARGPNKQQILLDSLTR